jgi:hypothetical protein
MTERAPDDHLMTFVNLLGIAMFLLIAGEFFSAVAAAPSARPRFQLTQSARRLRRACQRKPTPLVDMIMKH